MAFVEDAGPYVIALAGIGGGAWSTWLASRGNRQLEDLAHVRGVLDDAAVGLHHADQALGLARLEQITRGPMAFQPTDGVRSQALEDLQQAGLKLDVLNQRIAIRFGPTHAISTALNECCDQVKRAYDAAQLELLSMDPPGDDPDTRRQLRRYQDDAEEKVQSARDELARSRDAFLNAAVAEAGAVPRRRWGGPK